VQEERRERMQFEHGDFRSQLSRSALSQDMQQEGSLTQSFAGDIARKQEAGVFGFESTFSCRRSGKFEPQKDYLLTSDCILNCSG
jgi:hypothetical protein